MTEISAETERDCRYARRKKNIRITQIQTIKCGLNDTKKIKKKQVILKIYSFTLYTASDIVFKAFLLPKGTLAKKIITKNRLS